MADPQPTILIDTRERIPLAFGPEYRTERAMLPVADYGLKGFSDWTRPAFIVERKSVPDLIGSLTSGRARFMREIEKLRQFRFAGIVIEGERETVAAGEYGSRATPQSIMASLDAVAVRANIHVFWCGNAAGAARQIEGLVRQFVRGIEKDHKALTTAGAAA